MSAREAAGRRDACQLSRAGLAHQQVLSHTSIVKIIDMTMTCINKETKQSFLLIRWLCLSARPDVPQTQDTFVDLSLLATERGSTRPEWGLLSPCSRRPTRTSRSSRSS